MPLIKPKIVSPRGIFATLMPEYFCRRKHPQQMLKDDRSHMVPLDADEVFNRIKFKEKKFRQNIMEMYDAGIKTAVPRPKNTTWCVATGCFVPRVQAHATHIFPLALGSNIMEFICGHREIWSAPNGLMLAKPVKQALDDWALMIVPDNTQMALGRSRSNYKFRIMDSKHPAMSQTLYRQDKAGSLPTVTTGQLDGKELIFGNTNRPKEVIFYFQSCCAVWKKTYLENPECDDEADFAARFLSRLSEYWHPKFIKRSSLLDILLFKHEYSQPPLLEKPQSRVEEVLFRETMAPNKDCHNQTTRIESGGS